MLLHELLDNVGSLHRTAARWRSAQDPDARSGGAASRLIPLLVRDGPLTVPALARALGVSRQYAQQQADRLQEAGFVEKRDNPAHRRSRLIALTDRGRAMAETARSGEVAALDRLQTGVSDDAIADANRVLAALVQALETELQAEARRMQRT